MDTEAALAFQWARAGYPVRDIAKRLGLDAMTVCRRLDRLTLLQSQPSRSILRLIAAAQLDDLTRAAHQALYGTVAPDVETLTDRAIAQGLSPQDVAALVRVAAQLNREKRSLLGLDQTTDETNDGPLEPTAEPEEWELVAQEHRDEQAARIQNGDFDD